MRASIEAFGRMKRFISKGDIVVVKPNIEWDRLPEQAVITNPEVVAALVQMCLESGAKKGKVSDRPVKDPRRCYVQSGIHQAATAAGAEVSYIDKHRFRGTKINGLVLKMFRTGCRARQAGEEDRSKTAAGRPRSLYRLRHL